MKPNLSPILPTNLSGISVLKATNQSSGLARPSFKNRVKPSTMSSAYGTSKPLAFPKMKAAF